MKPIPSSDAIQAWIHGIKPYDYFERTVDRPGLLVLRAKAPVCRWQGLHLAMSDGWREHLREDLSLLLRGQAVGLDYRSSHPDGRDWFNLYTCGVDFGSWLKTTIVIDSQLTGLAAWIRYVDRAVQIRMSELAASILRDELAPSPLGGVRSSLPLMRDAKPSSEPQALWLWHWSSLL